MKRRFVIPCLSAVLIAIAGLWVGCSRNQAGSPVDPEPAATPAGKVDLSGSDGGRIHTQIALSGHLDATASAEGCENNPGPFITLTGETDVAREASDILAALGSGTGGAG